VGGKNEKGGGGVKSKGARINSDEDYKTLESWYAKE